MIDSKNIIKIISVEDLARNRSGPEETPEETDPSSTLPSERNIIKEIIEAIRTTPELRNAYMCHGEPHMDLSTDYEAIAVKIRDILDISIAEEELNG